MRCFSALDILYSVSGRRSKVDGIRTRRGKGVMEDGGMEGGGMGDGGMGGTGIARTMVDDSRLYLST
jgi:hypothetical protein